MEAKYLEVSGRTYYAFEEPNFIGPMPLEQAKKAPTLSMIEKYAEGDIEARFWRRQFGWIVTSKQKKYDWFFGIILPSVCFFFDPIVFRGWYDDEGMLIKYKIFAYLLSGTAIMGLAAWLLWGERLKAFNAPLAGLFFAAGVIAAIIGITLIPMSVIGTVVFIGLLGFTPFFTSIIFLRNAVRSRRAVLPYFDSTTLNYVTAVSALAAFTIAWLANAASPTASRAIQIFGF